MDSYPADDWLDLAESDYQSPAKSQFGRFVELVFAVYLHSFWIDTRSLLLRPVIIVWPTKTAQTIEANFIDTKIVIGGAMKINKIEKKANLGLVRRPSQPLNKRPWLQERWKLPEALSPRKCRTLASVLLVPDSLPSRFAVIRSFEQIFNLIFKQPAQLAQMVNGIQF